LLQATHSVTAGGTRQRRGRRSKGRKGVDYQHSEPFTPWELTNKLGDVESLVPAGKKGLASQLKKKPWYDTSTSKQKDPNNSSDSSDEDDFYEGSGSEGSAEGDEQYGTFFTCFHFSVCSTKCCENLPLCHIFQLLNY
jgi:hypothetical protein